MRGSVVKKGDKYYVKIEPDPDPDPVTGKRRQKWHSGCRTKRQAGRARVDLLSKFDRRENVEPSPRRKQVIASTRYGYCSLPPACDEAKRAGFVGATSTSPGVAYASFSRSRGHGAKSRLEKRRRRAAGARCRSTRARSACCAITGGGCCGGGYLSAPTSLALCAQGVRVSRWTDHRTGSCSSGGVIRAVSAGIRWCSRGGWQSGGVSIDPRIAEFEALVVELRAEIEALRSENAELRARLGKDSGNSSIPPSRDGRDRRVRRAEEREASALGCRWRGGSPAG